MVDREIRAIDTKTGAGITYEERDNETRLIVVVSLNFHVIIKLYPDGTWEEIR